MAVRLDIHYPETFNSQVCLAKTNRLCLISEALSCGEVCCLGVAVALGPASSAHPQHRCGAFSPQWWASVLLPFCHIFRKWK